MNPQKMLTTPSDMGSFIIRTNTNDDLVNWDFSNLSWLSVETRFFEQSIKCIL